MRYIEIKITTSPEVAEWVLAELTAIGYDSFQELDEGLDAYIEAEQFSEEKLKEVLSRYAENDKLTYSFGLLEDKNWNEEWEKNFQPVIIDDTCIIRASFHEAKKDFAYNIVINPKMSFGTGHHETTSMMVSHQLGLDHKGKTVIDAGSGTGVLAILASKLGASTVDAFDVEDWAFENLKENVNLNDCTNIQIEQGTITEVSLSLSSYDIILANINRNVLLDEMPEYAKRLNRGGSLVLSGFYLEDIPMIEKRANEFGLSKISFKEQNNWVSLIFILN